MRLLSVAIFGDTSDENNTDSEQLFKDLGNGSSAQSAEERCGCLAELFLLHLGSLSYRKGRLERVNCWLVLSRLILGSRSMRKIGVSTASYGRECTVRRLSSLLWFGFVWYWMGKAMTYEVTPPFHVEAYSMAHSKTCRASGFFIQRAQLPRRVSYFFVFCWQFYRIEAS